METKLPVFVYGTLLKGWSNYERYVRPYPHEAIPAEVRGELYHLPTGYPGLLAGRDRVRGNVLYVSPEEYEQVLAGLDELETYYGPGDPRNEYERTVITARLHSGAEVEAYVYLYVDEKYARAEGTPVADGDWSAFMRKRQPE